MNTKFGSMLILLLLGKPIVCLLNCLSTTPFLPNRLVTHNSLREETPALHFTWTPGNQILDDMEVEDVSQMLKEASVQLCLMESECLYFRTIDQLFKDEAVRIFNRYLMDNEKSITTLIDRDSGLYSGSLYCF